MRREHAEIASRIIHFTYYISLGTDLKIRLGFRMEEKSNIVVRRCVCLLRHSAILCVFSLIWELKSGII
jgi:hypothetical protein